MILRHTCALSEYEQEGLLALRATASLRGAADLPAIQAFRRQIAGCPACAAEAAGLLALLQWREAEAPFNRSALPVPPDLPGLVGAGAGKGVT